MADPPLRTEISPPFAAVNGGGEGGIRTHGRVAPTHAFQACRFVHSRTSPRSAALKRRHLNMRPGDRQGEQGSFPAMYRRIQLILYVTETIGSRPNYPIVWVDTWIHPTVQPQYNIAWVCGSKCRGETLRRCSLVREWRNWQTRET